MTDSDIKNTSDYTFQDTPSKESIREWRSSMETFYNEEWKQVGRIITRLEDSLWEGATPSHAERSEDRRVAGESNCEAQLEAMRKTAVPASNDPRQKQRLEEIAKKIEERLSNSKRD